MASGDFLNSLTEGWPEDGRPRRTTATSPDQFATGLEPSSGGQEQPEWNTNPTPWQDESMARPWTGPTQTPDRNSWDTDGYATPSYTATNFGNAPSGWDNAKWSDPNHQTPKYVVGRILVSNGNLADPNNRNKAIEQIKQAYPGAQFNGKDKISIDGGKSWVDIFGGASAGIYSPAWQDESVQGGGNGAAYSPGIASTYSANAPMQVAPTSTPTFSGPLPNRPNFSWTDENGVRQNTNGWDEAMWRRYYTEHPGDPYAQQANNGATPATSTTGGGPMDPIEAAMQDPKGALMRQLMERMKQSTDVKASDKEIQGQLNAFRAEKSRANKEYLQDIAESNGPYNTGAIRGEQRMAADRLGSSVGSMAAQLVSRELQTRRDEIKGALDSMGNLLTEGERQGLQRELAQLDASIRRQQMDLQNQQFNAQLSQADKHFLAQLAQQGRFADMDNAFRYSQLGQNDSQWRDQLGFNQQQERNKWDWLQRGN